MMSATDGTGVMLPGPFMVDGGTPQIVVPPNYPATTAPPAQLDVPYFGVALKWWLVGGFILWMVKK